MCDVSLENNTGVALARVRPTSLECGVSGGRDPNQGLARHLIAYPIIPMQLARERKW